MNLEDHIVAGDDRHVRVCFIIHLIDPPNIVLQLIICLFAGRSRDAERGEVRGAHDCVVEV